MRETVYLIFFCNSNVISCLESKILIIDFKNNFIELLAANGLLLDYLYVRSIVIFACFGT